MFCTHLGWALLSCFHLQLWKKQTLSALYVEQGHTHACMFIYSLLFYLYAYWNTCIACIRYFHALMCACFTFFYLHGIFARGHAPRLTTCTYIQATVCECIPSSSMHAYIHTYIHTLHTQKQSTQLCRKTHDKYSHPVTHSSEMGHFLTAFAF
jgi:hypothetical protein